MKKNKGLFGGVLEVGGNMIGKVMDVTLSVADKISRGLLGDKITDAVETPLKAVEKARLRLVELESCQKSWNKKLQNMKKYPAWEIKILHQKDSTTH